LNGVVDAIKNGFIKKGQHIPLDYVNPKIPEHASGLTGILTAGCNEGALSIYSEAGLAVVNMPGNIPLDESQYYDEEVVNMAKGGTRSSQDGVEKTMSLDTGSS